MKAFIFTIIFIVSITTTPHAQNSDREVYPRQVSIEHNEAVKNFSTDFITAYPAGSALANLKEISEGTSLFSSINMIGNDNLALLLQKGYNTASIINIFGNANVATINQRGYDLLSILNIKGNSNQFNMVQQGSGLDSEIYVLGSEMNISAFQNHKGMNLIQRGAGVIPLSIHHSGRSIPIFIRNN